MTSRSGSPLLALFLTVVIDLLGFGIVLPLLPLYAEAYGAAEMVIGLLFVSFSGTQFLAAPFWGRLSDRIGRRPVILLGLGGSTTAYALFAASTFLPHPVLWLFVSRIVAGVFGGTISTAYAYIADVTPESERARAMALIGVAFGIGFTLGPALGGLGHALHPALPGAVAAAASVASLLYARLHLAEPSQHIRRGARSWLDLSAAGRAIRRRGFAGLGAVLFLAVSCFALMESTLGLMARRQYGFDVWEIGLLFSYLGLCSALMQGVVVRRALRHVREGPVALLGTLVLGAGLALLATGGGTLHLALLAPLPVLGFGMVVPSVNGLISRGTPATEQGEVLGLAQSLQSLARIAGPMLGLSLLGLASSLPFLVGGGLMLFAFSAAFGSLRRIEHRIEPPGSPPRT